MSLDCYFRRKNNRQCDITYEYTDNVSALAVVPFGDCSRFVFLQYLWSPDHDLQYPRSSPYCMSNPFQTAPSRLIYAAQYRLDGVVKQFRHPYRLEVLRKKESKAVAVSAILSRRLSHIINPLIDFVERQ
jgi:hypothetical protein